MAKASGKLSRSEKKLFLVTGVAIVLILALGEWRSYVDAIPDVNIPTPKMPEPNAYDFYVKAGQAIIPVKPAVDPIHDPVDVPKAQWEKRYPTAAKEAWLRRNAKALTLLRQGFKYECRAPAQRQLNLSPGPYSKFRDLARLLVVESNAYAERGEWGKASQSAIDALELGNDIGRGGALLDALSGYAVNSIGRKQLWTILPRLTRHELNVSVRRQQNIFRSRVPFAEILTDEKYSGQANLLEYMKFKGWRGINLRHSTGIARLQDLWQAYNTPNHFVFKNYSEFMDRQIKAANQTYTPPNMQPLDASDPYTSLMAPVIEQTRWSNAKAGVASSLQLTAFALRLYYLEKKRFPEKLEQLAPQFILQVPNDAYSNGTNLRYYLTGKHARDYILYSVGPDTIDNHGRAIEDKSKSGRRRYLVQLNSKGDFVAGINH